MNSDQIKAIVHKEVGDRWDTTNEQGIVLNDCLIDPLKKKYYSSDDSESSELWTVLEELPDGTGYRIVYVSFNQSVGEAHGLFERIL